MTLRAHKRIGLAYVPTPLLPQGHLGETMPSVDPSATATRSHEAISPFRIAIEQHALDDLRERLDRTRWPDELPGVGWGYGIPLVYVKELAHYWRHEFDWRAAEERLNACAQFTTTIDGANLHFAHIRSPEPDAMPLIMIHGWPGSFAEFTEIAGPLVDPIAHGGERQDAVHLVLLGLLSPAERDRTIASWAAFQEWLGERDGYAAMQSTRPQTLAYGLTDSPVGQLAWIMEKFKDWTDSHDRAENAIDRDHLLTNVSIYWFTATAGSSARIYHERAHADHQGSPPEPSSAPTAVAVFPRDNFIPLRHVGERTNTIVRWTEFDRGGHFAAMEQPDLLIADIRAFVRQLRDDR
jgi:epoxide hydrolase